MHYIVWNENKTEGFVTNDPGLAYEVRKSAESNCYYENGDGDATVAKEFCNKWGAGTCTMETLPSPGRPGTAADIGCIEYTCQRGKGDPPMDCIYPNCPCGDLFIKPEYLTRGDVK